MAVVASRGTVGITADTLMLLVRLGLLMRGGGVAVDAGELRIIRRNLVAVGADRTMVRNGEICVIERRAQPVSGRMAAIARGWVTGSDVVRDRTAQGLCTDPFSGVAAVAGGVR